MTIKTNTNFDTLIEGWIIDVEHSHKKGDTPSARALLAMTEKVLTTHLAHFRENSTERHVEFFLHIASLYHKLDDTGSNAAHHAALQGLSVLADVCQSPVAHPLWQALMSHIPH